MPFRVDPYLGQIYAGFQALERAGVVEIDWLNEGSSPPTQPILEVDIDGRSAVYDMLDGLNWVPGGADRNLAAFRLWDHRGWYFKRSFCREIVEAAPPGRHVHDLGLNYPVAPHYVPASHPRSHWSRAKASPLVRRLAGRDVLVLPQEDYVAPPSYGAPRVLFLTRLWDPEAPEVETDGEREWRREMNDRRIDWVRACRREFGPRFTGGIQSSTFAESRVPAALLAPTRTTRKTEFLRLVKTHSVCVTSLGLHESTGWRFGEFMAASRAVVSERLRYSSPGLVNGREYLDFESSDELLSAVTSLLESESRREELMRAASTYYDTYLRPDRVVHRSVAIAMGWTDQALA